ncbi:MAG: DUF4372 domain-containing protein [Bacteroidales bacterium]|nr:DUF4372 domain-containing protein [Candidatus Equimonas faecalis]
MSSFFNQSKFDYIVEMYNGGHCMQFVTCWAQPLSLMFGQLCSNAVSCLR